MENYVFIKDAAILILSLLKERYGDNRKLITQHIKCYPTIYSNILFCMLNSRDYEKEIRKVIDGIK